MALAGMSRDHANRLVAHAIARGVNYFDVAPSYGDGSAEEMLGAALGSHRDTVFLASKTLKRSAEDARLDLEQSLRRLRRGHIDLFQFHAVIKRKTCAESSLLTGQRRPSCAPGIRDWSVFWVSPLIRCRLR